MINTTQGILIEEFSFENFRSFKDLQTLNMTSSRLKSANPKMDLDNLLREEEKNTLLKTKLIYGANAGGKSNIIKALSIFLEIIKKSLKDEEIISRVTPFMLDDTSLKKPSNFQLIFRVEGVKFRYGYEVYKGEVLSEWLFQTHLREEPIFIREGQTILEINKSQFPKGAELVNLEFDLFTSKSLFINVAKSIGDNLATKVVNSILSIIVVGNESDLKLGKQVFDRLENKKEKDDVLAILKLADIGIKGIDFFKVSENEVGKDFTFLLSMHDFYEEGKLKSSIPLLLEEAESEGTKSILCLSPILIEALRERRPIIIDEFGSKLHPMLARNILNMFQTQTACSQIIVATHCTELMSPKLLRRDQIDLVEKDKFGASHLYSLAEVKGIRDNNKFNREYLQGLYGAIPILGNWDNIEKILTDGEEN